MSGQIRLYLLSNTPTLELDGRLIHLPDSSLDLFIYLAVENEAIHDRDVLTRRLYETTRYRDRLRQAALGNLNKEIKDLCIRPSPPNTVGYDGSHVWVDVHEFTNLMMPDGESVAVTKLTYPRLLAACELYQQHFLEIYRPTLYGLTSWIQEQRHTFRELFHVLLERLVQHEIIQENYGQALGHAERWHQSLPDSELPLQYLIWLAARMDLHVQILSYLNRLEALDSSELRLIGYSPEEWRRLLDRGLKPEIRVLKLSDEVRIEVSELLDIASEYLTGRDEALEDVFETLFTIQEHKLLTLTGVRGVGKTALAEAVAAACRQTGLVKRVIQVGVTAETNFDQVLNAIAVQIDKPHLVDLDYRNKYVSIEQELKSETSLLILDQQEAGDVFSAEFRKRAQAISEQTRVIICSHKPWPDVYEVGLQPLELLAAASLFKTCTGNALESETDADALRSVTEGSPLAIKLFASAISSNNLSLPDALAQLRDISDETRKLEHDPILYWCWHLLDETSRRVLASFMDFDLLEGPTVELLDVLHSDLSTQAIDSALQQLENMNLVERRDGHLVYRWHSLLHEFLTAIDALALASNDPQFKSQFRERFCALYLDYLADDPEDYQRLDRQQRNLLHAFDVGLAQGIITLAQVNLLLPYLIARGLYVPARRIAERAAPLVTNANMADDIDLLLNTGRLDIKQGEILAAEQQLHQALELAQEADDTLHLGEIYHQLGNIVRMQGQFEQSNELLNAALQHARNNHDSKLIAIILANMGVSAIERGEYEAANQHLHESLSAAQTVNYLRVIEFAYTSLGVIANEQFNFDHALAYLAEAQAIAHRIGSPERQAIIFLNAGVAHYYLEQYDDAEVNVGNALEIAQRLQHEEVIANLLRNLGRVEAVKGNLLEAEKHYKQALIAASDHGLKRLAASVLLDIGKLTFQAHNRHYAHRCFHEALTIALELQNYDLVAEALFGLGINAAAENWIIGPDDEEKTLQAIRISWESGLLARLSGLSITRTQLEKAEFLFQHGLVNFPDIPRYRVTEVLAKLIATDEKNDP